MQIQRLDSQTINQIAAGEVVERPASAVKELVENAIDAGAKRISITIEGGGIERIQITDNGRGIDHRELPLAIERHATSKIKEIDDLLLSRSLGFRGEALASIASVSKLSITSRTSDGPAYVIEVEDGETLGIRETGAAIGTTVIVEHLFAHMPARRKFLKTPTTEGGHIQKVVEHLALSHPDISFSLMVDGRVKLQTSGNGDVKEVVYAVFGREVADQLIEVSSESEHLKVHGYLGTPQIGKGNRSYEVFFVNGRHIQNQMLSYSVEEGYHGFLMQHKYPFVLLYLDVPLDEIDVNVHPAKADIRFAWAQKIRVQLSQMVADHLRTDRIVPKVEFPKIDQVEQKAGFDRDYYMREMKKRVTHGKQMTLRDEAGRNDEAAGKSLGQQADLSAIFGESKDAPNQVFEDHENARHPAVGEAKIASHLQKEEVTGDEVYTQRSLMDDLLYEEKKRHYRLVGQAFRTYWIAECDEELWILDQHAAHEKVLYERISAMVDQGDIPSQMLAPGWVIHLSPQEEESLNKHADVFRKYGFLIESYGERDYLVRGIPLVLTSGLSREVLSEMLSEISREEGASASSASFEDALATRACKAAVKGNTAMTAAEMETLLNELVGLDNPYHCPHGRPTMIRMTKKDMEKSFQRIVQ